MEGRRRAEAKLREWLQRVETGEDEGEVKVETDGDIHLPDSVLEDGKPAATRSQQQREQSNAVRENEKSRSNRPREVVDLLSDDSE